MASHPVIPDPPRVSEGDLFRKAMGEHVASVCIITTRSNGLPYAVTATAVSSVCAEPPRLLVCVNRSGETEPMIREAGVFTVNVLNEDQEPLATLFGSESRAARADCLRQSDWESLATGAPVHAAALAAIDCRVSSTIEQGSHTIFIGDVVATASTGSGDALLYGRRSFRRLTQTRQGATA
ncbi:4-nitrophenol 4-monooxygenase/4-nitrocatechol 2-monooxygenase, reductase component (plasmid) [Sphingobium sp. AntQ-1]|uniref:flavin reductase family protein n=1 Tax=Sphingobium sp. AntQ-1 TaxID=2930091 RepID=UPI00234EDEC2|nr:flavin reductase family protein [Sphingobium sp. AntQ-1]WCP16279.1 4-nitrophenol 4-monooxygenase/4-nitrocatechol 2-monooxygenase, reductase component [Sphingobium sp. AntQ-1]